MIRNLTAATAVLTLACMAGAPALAQAVPAYVAAAVADPSRPAADSSRDAGRKPGPTVAFAGVKPGDKVAELQPGGGYYTRVLAKTVGPKGHVYAVSGNARGAGATQAIAAEPAYANVTAVVSPMSEIKVSEPVDVVWTTENYHDMHNGGGDMGPINKAAFNALKPGGVYLISDHMAAPGASAADQKTLHRIDEAIVKSEVLAAGFVLDGESNVLHNTTDPHTVASHDESVHDKTDQFLLRFRKPK